MNFAYRAGMAPATFVAGEVGAWRIARQVPISGEGLAPASRLDVRPGIEQPSHAVANGYYVGTINRVGIEAEFGDDDFYGQSYFVDPRGQFVGDVGDAHDEELIVRDLDLDKIAEVRNTWQFYRDRRPDAYDDLTRP